MREEQHKAASCNDKLSTGSSSNTQQVADFCLSSGEWRKSAAEQENCCWLSKTEARRAKMADSEQRNPVPAAVNYLVGELCAPTASLVDRLIDSQLEWRQLVGEANGPEAPLSAYLSEAQIKRQELIHELIRTERHHCLTLALMRQVYLAGAIKLNAARQQPAPESSEVASSVAASQQQQQQQQQSTSCQELIELERLFPALDELISAHELFFAHLRLRLVECCQPQVVGGAASDATPLVGIVGPLGDLLVEQFRVAPAEQRLQQEVRRRRAPLAEQSRAAPARQSQKTAAQQTNGQKLLQAYGKFCGRHFESSRYYKQLLQCDKEFKHFIEVSYALVAANEEERRRRTSGRRPFLWPRASSRASLCARRLALCRLLAACVQLCARQMSGRSATCAATQSHRVQGESSAAVAAAICAPNNRKGEALSFARRTIGGGSSLISAARPLPRA